MTNTQANHPTGQVCTTSQVIQLWTLPNKKPPSQVTIWRRIKRGEIPKPRKVGNQNLFNTEEVIRLRNQIWGIG